MRVSAEPPHPGKFRSKDRFSADGTTDTVRGGWWELAADKPGPHHFGALSGTDATSGWQDAINYAALTGRTIYPIDGVYLLASPPRAFSGLLLIPTGTNITIQGSGRGCRLKLPDRLSDRGDYRIMVAADKQPMGDITISNLTFDGNGTNNLVKDSKANIRSGYCLLLFNGRSADLHDLWFENIAGRSAVVLGYNGNTPDWDSVRLVDNHIRNVGGAIPGNEAQNDHSTFFVQSATAEISGNDFSNNNDRFDPQSAPHRAVTALEIHSANAVIENNVTTNYGTGGMAVSIKFPVAFQAWRNNKFLRCKSNAFKTFTKKEIGHLIVSGNQIEVDNRHSSGGCGIFQDPSPSETTATIKKLDITDNIITSMLTAPAPYTTHGVLLCAFASLSFLRNQLSFWQGDGLRLEDQDGPLSISSATIDQCQFRNCGMQISGANPFAIYILNRNTKKTFDGIEIGSQNRIWQDKGPAGATPSTGRGIRVRGPGSFRNVAIHAPQTSNIPAASRLSILEASKTGIRLL